MLETAGQQAQVPHALRRGRLAARRLLHPERQQAGGRERQRLQQHRPAHAQGRRHERARERAGDDARELRGLEPRHQARRLRFAAERLQRVVGERLVGARDEGQPHGEDRLGADEDGNERQAAVEQGSRRDHQAAQANRDAAPETVGDGSRRHLHQEAHQHEPGLEREDRGEAQPPEVAEEGDDHRAHQVRPAQEAHRCQAPEVGLEPGSGMSRGGRDHGIGFCHASRRGPERATRAVY
jgi:hypothetical protein